MKSAAASKKTKLRFELLLKASSDKKGDPSSATEIDASAIASIMASEAKARK